VDLAWTNGGLTSVQVLSKLGKPCCLRSGAHEVACQTEVGKTYRFDGDLQVENSP
jgi:alpha-L-fucosidase 2